MKNLGAKLASWREAAGLSQKQVSDRMGYSTAQFVSNWEREVSVPPMIAVKKLSTIYGVEKSVMGKVIADALVQSYSAKVHKKLSKIS